jgi:hypothetical protein
MADPTTRASFERDMRRADALIVEAVQLRRRAWADYRDATGLSLREKTYA